jgi:Icc-related predicted phosphoesterase
MTKIVALSDTHKQESLVKVPECDILIHAGDNDCESLKDLIKFANWFKSQKAKHHVYVPGNHDFYTQNDYNTAKLYLQEHNIHFLVDKAVTLENLKIYGSPWCKRFYDWAWMLGHEEIKEKWDLIPNDVDILVTHNPPYKILDQERRGAFCGCEHLLKRVKEIKPKIHIFGHIHEGYGIKPQVWGNYCIDLSLIKDKTFFVNASQTNEYYDLINKPIEIQL